jgi:hypothetical protein
MIQVGLLRYCFMLEVCVTYKRICGLMIEFIGQLYHLLQHFADQHLQLDTLDFWPHCTNSLFLEQVKVTLRLTVSQSTERPPLVGEVNANLQIEGVTWSEHRIPTAVNAGFLDPEPLLLDSSSTENRTGDLWICSQELWPLYHRGGPGLTGFCKIWQSL